MSELRKEFRKITGWKPHATRDYKPEDEAIDKLVEAAEKHALKRLESFTERVKEVVRLTEEVDEADYISIVAQIDKELESERKS